MHRFVLQAACGRFRPHPALTNDQLYAGLLNKLFLELFHPHAGGRADGDHLETAIVFFANNWPRMEDRPTTQIYRQLALELDQAAVRDVTAGHQLAGQVNHVTNVQVSQILVLDWRIQYLLHRTTPSWERMS
ncbi:hypothetical protein D9M71_556970 [compost metagenome]